MARPLRIPRSDTFYHVMSRGNARQPIYNDDADRMAFLQVLADVADQYHIICHTYCLMPNHYHLVLETPDANLSSAIRQLNGVYAQQWNRRQDRVGHVFQGRFKAQLVQKHDYFLEVSRYVVLNPVRAKLVDSPAAWPWSSYRATAGLTTPPAFLTTSVVLAEVGGVVAYRSWINTDTVKPLVPSAVRDDVRAIGHEAYARQLRASAGAAHPTEVPSRERTLGRPRLEELLSGRSHRQLDGKSILEARAAYGYALREIAEHLGIHYSTVSKIVARVRRSRANGRDVVSDAHVRPNFKT